MALHLGPLGALRTLRGPAPDIPIEHPRHGGTHVLLTGRRVVDYLGGPGAYTFTWAHLQRGEADYLEALRDRQVPGPLRFVLDGWKHNRLSRSAAAVGYGGRDLSEVAVGSGYTEPSNQWPAAVPIGGRGLHWVNYSTGTSITLDEPAPVPVLTGETLTASVYVLGTHTDTVRLDAAHYTAGGYTAATTGTAVTLTAGAWQRLTLTVTPPADVWALAPKLVATTRVTGDAALTLAAGQVEAGTVATDWARGGGAPRVAVEAAPFAQPRARYSDVEMTLVEA